MSNYVFKVGDKGKTAMGREYEVVLVDSRLDYPIRAIINSGKDLYLIKEDGGFAISGTDTLLPPERMVYLNVWTQSCTVHYTKEEAQAYAINSRRAGTPPTRVAIPVDLNGKD